MIQNNDINFRDPFVVPVKDNKTYYLFGTIGSETWGGPASGFNVYTGTDLEHWEGPFKAFRPPLDFWSDQKFWAPEVHRYRGRWYLLATFNSRDGKRQGTAILTADHVAGPYAPHSEGPVTPTAWRCLDGTLYVDPDNKPWMVFCHEWLEVKDGQICAIRLSEDLRRATGEPVVLFRASEPEWVSAYPREDTYVTDGPFMFRTAAGDLLMLWATFKDGKYAQAVARSSGGGILGPWEHQDKALYQDDGGHGMVFRTFEGQMMLTLHKPNDTPNERPVFLPVEEHQDKTGLRLQSGA